MNESTIAMRRAGARTSSLPVALLALALATSGCSGEPASRGRVQAVITPDGTFDSSRITRLRLAVDGDGDVRVNVDVPLEAGLGNGITTDYQPRSGITLVVAAYALDASGARVASGIANPVVVTASAVTVVPIVLGSSGRVDAGAPRDLSVPPDLSVADL